MTLLWFCGTLSAQQDLVITDIVVVPVSGCDRLAKTGSIEIRVEGGEEPYTYQWKKVGAGILEEQNSSIISGLGAGEYLVTVTDNDGIDNVSEIFNITTPDVVRSMPMPENVLCNGDQTGAITVWATSNVSTLSFFLLNKDKTIHSTVSGTAFVTFPELPANTYHTVAKNDVSLCVDTSFNITISEPPPLKISFGQTKIVCVGDRDATIEVSAEGGTGSYQYKIDNGDFGGNSIIGGLLSGTHTITAKDFNNCEISDEIEVLGIPNPDLSTSEVSKLNCYNDKGEITIHAIPYVEGEYSDNKITAYWIKGEHWQESDHGMRTKFDNLNDDTFTLSAMDKNGCIGTEVVVLAGPESPPWLHYDKEKITYPHGDVKGSVTFTVTGGWGGYTIECILIGSGGYHNVIETLTDVPIGTECTFSNLESGMYLFTIDDESKCKISRSHQYVELFDQTTTGEIDLEAADLNIFPNPSSDGKFIIEWSSNESRKVTLELYNIKGQLIYKTNAQTGTSARTTLDLSNQRSGIYLLRVPELNIIQKIIIH